MFGNLLIFDKYSKIFLGGCIFRIIMLNNNKLGKAFQNPDM